MRSTHLSAAMLIVAAAAVGHALAAESDDPALLADDPVNRTWKLEGPRGDVLVFQRAPGNEPVLIVNAPGVRGRQITADIETDSSVIRIRNSATQIELRLAPAKRYRFTFDGDANNPKIELNGRALLREQEAWARIVNDVDRPTFQLMIEGATEARVTLRAKGRPVKLFGDGGGAGGQLDTAAGGAATTPRATGPGPAERARSAVFTLRVPTGAKDVYRVVPAFLIDDDGFAIAPYAELHGVARAEAILAERATPEPIELYAVDPAHGLALLKLDRGALVKLGTFAPIKPETEKLKADAKVWAIGPAAWGRTALAEMQLTGGLLAEDMPGDHARAIRPPAGSRWINLTLPITPDIAGVPLVNEQGRAVGITVWSWPVGAAPANAGRALYIGAARELYEKRPAQPLTFARAVIEQARADPLRMQFPRTDSFVVVPIPDVIRGLDDLDEAMQAFTPEQANDAAARNRFVAALRRAVGTGMITQASPADLREVRSRWAKFMEKFVAHPGIDAVAETFGTESEVVLGDPRRIGDIVFIFGEVQPGSRAPAFGRDWLVLKVVPAGSRRMLMQSDQGFSANRLREGETIVGMSRFSGFVRDGDGQLCAVLTIDRVRNP